MSARPTLQRAILWIAENDDAVTTDVALIRGYLSVKLVADLFGVPCEHIANRVLWIRETFEQPARAR